MAIAELKVWRVPVNKHFPEGIKYSLYLVDKATGVVLLGYDNHRPKGHHVHVGDDERAYGFIDVDSLVEEFWSQVEARGFLTS